MNKQKGYIDLDLAPLFWLAGIGAIVLLLGIPYILYWLITHISIIIL